LSEEYTSREIEAIDIAAHEACLDNGSLQDMMGDVSKSGYRMPIQHGRLPTLTTGSKIHHFGLNERLNGFVLLSS
jgi:hypothetical protein